MDTFIRGASKDFRTEIKKDYPTRPVISKARVDQLTLKSVCPTHAIGVNPIRIDLGKCVFCGLCENQFPQKIHFSDDAAIVSNVRDRLIVIEGEDQPIIIDQSIVRYEIASYQKNDLAFLLIGDAPSDSHQYTANGTSFRFASSAAEAQGVIITTAITEDVEEQVDKAAKILQQPRLIIAAGESLRSSFFEHNASYKIKNKIQIDIFIPGDAFHPETLALALNAISKTKNI